MREVGIGTRVLNFVVDTIVVFLISYGVYKFEEFYATYYGTRYFPFYQVFWIMLVVYYFVMEGLTGKTIGKYMSVTRVRTASGKRPVLWQMLVRSVSRVILIDAFFIPFLDRTLHDALSKTRVVED